MRRFVTATILGVSLFCFPALAKAAPGPYLQLLYKKRADLQKLFDAKTYLAKPDAETPATNLEDWARQTGWRTDKKLLFYKPANGVPVAISDEKPPEGTALSYAVIDQATGLVLAEKNADDVHRIASLTKLATIEVALSNNVALNHVQPIVAADQVGGSRLGVKAGTKFTVSDLLYAALLPSANDATNALADATHLARDKFVALMNAKAKEFGLLKTAFSEPSGIDDGNVSTALEYAYLARNVYARSLVRQIATTAKRTIKLLPSGKKITIKNGDRLLTYPEYADVHVIAGKTGYLGPENGCNLAVGLKSPTGAPRPVIIVLLGENKMTQTMNDAHDLAKWAWAHYEWR